jgi:hypothetical protein
MSYYNKLPIHLYSGSWSGVESRSLCSKKQRRASWSGNKSRQASSTKGSFFSLFGPRRENYYRCSGTFTGKYDR